MNETCKILAHNFVAKFLVSSLQFFFFFFISKISIIGIRAQVMQLNISFLWKDSAKGVKVSWDWVCHFKAEGGLEVKTSISLE